MRELTKSMMSFSWAMSLFGLKQAANLLMPQTWGQAASSLNGVSSTTEGQLGQTLRSLYRAGDSMQKGMVDMMFGMIGSGGTWNPAAWAPGATGAMRTGADAICQTAQAGVDLMQRSTQAVPSAPQPQSGWGPIPAPGA